MRIQEVQVKNYRSIQDEILPCDSLTALVGPNGSGKSSFLSAIELFYEPSSKVTEEDFYSEDTSQDIEITITYTDLSAEARGLFSPYIDNEQLTVVRVFSLAEGKRSGTYHGIRLQNPDFSPIRIASGAREAIRIYREIRQSDEYTTLPVASSTASVQSAMDDWERQNPEECIRMRDNGQFFGFTNVGQGRLTRHTRFIRVPAVRDALDDAMEKRGSCVTEIMDLVVRSVLADRKELADFKERTQNEYKEIIDPGNLTELQGLQSALTETLQHYAPETGVFMNWSEAGDMNWSEAGDIDPCHRLRSSSWKMAINPQSRELGTACNGHSLSLCCSTSWQHVLWRLLLKPNLTQRTAPKTPIRLIFLAWS